MTPSQYENFRNRLIDLLLEAARIESLSERARALIGRLRKKTLEDQFMIVLAGEFQGGKSTTFNALCDGRELSPAGSGIKTSGCVVSAGNIADPDEPEKALVHWRSPSELVEGFSDAILPGLQESAPGRFGKIDASLLGEAVDLNDESDRMLVAQAVERQWRIYEENMAASEPANFDALRCASIVVRFFDEADLRELRQRKDFSPEEIGRMIVFPEDWEQRWLAKNAGAFDLREVLFVFIRGIELKIHSPNLGRMGCVFVDCPGLFAGRRDTEIAREAMIEADIVLYLFDGSRTLKRSDLNTLSFIRNNGMEYKLFYGCNIRGLSFEDGIRVWESSIEALRERGYPVCEQEFVLFHALLALRSVQGERFLNGLPPHGKRYGGEFEPIEDRLFEDIDRCLSILGREKQFSRLDRRMVEEARRAAGLGRLVNAVEETVIRKKARSILIDNGARIGVDCLLEIEATLRNRELSAFRKESEFKRHSLNAELELKKFRDNCRRIIAGLDDTTPDELLADDLWERLFGLRQTLCEKSAERIYKEVLTLKNISALLVGKSRLNRLVSAIVKSDLDEGFKEVLGGWASEIKDGKNPVYNQYLTGMIRAVNRKLKRAWNESALSDMELTSGISIPEFSGDLRFDDEKILRELEQSEVMENIRSHAFLAAGSFTGVFTAASGVFVAIFALATRIFWMVIASAAVIVVNLLLVFLTKGFTEKALKEEIRQKLSPAYDALFDRMEPEAKEKFREFPASVRTIYRQALLSASRKPEKIYRERKIQVETDLEKSREEREHIAEEARRIRETRIRPLRIRLSDFASEVEKTLEINADKTDGDNRGRLESAGPLP